MKIRTGFVSNSSSSSFIFAGYRKGDLDNIHSIKFEASKQYVMIGKYLYDGYDIILFDLNIKKDKELLQWFIDNQKEVLENCSDLGGDIYELVKCGEDYLELDPKKLPDREEKLICTSYEADYHTTSSIKYAEKYYLGKE